MSGRIAIVFGGAGFIGSHLIAALKDSGGYSRIISADIRTRTPAIVDDVEHVFCDVRRPIQIAGDVDGAEIYNLGAVHTTPGHPDWEYFDTNVHGALEVCYFAGRIGSPLIAFTSSISTYGPTEEPRDERGALEPDSAYGRSKRMAEDIYRMWQSGSSDRRLVIVRPAVIFGPGENGNFTRLAKALKRGFFVYPGRRDAIKSCGHVGELVRSLQFVRDLGLPEVTYNYAYPERYTSEQICEAFHKVGGYRRPTLSVPLSFMLAVGLAFEVLAALGKKTSINRARMMKLVRSTNIVPRRLVELGYVFETDLTSGLARWKAQSKNGEFV